MSGNETCRVCGGREAEVVASGIRDWEYGAEGSFSQCRCTACGVIQLSPFPGLDELKRAYDVPYHGYAETGRKGLIYRLLFSLNERLLQRRFQGAIPPGARLLDIGCGSGQFLASLQSLGPSACDGVDFSPVAVAKARDNGVNAVEGIFLELPEPEQPYDALFMNNYLEHTLQPAEELARARRFLKPSGRLLGEVPNFRSLDRALFGRYWGGNHVPRHTFQFTPASLERLLTQNGFGNVRITHELNTGHWALSVQNLLQRNRPDLRHNPALTNGRAGYFSPLLFLFLPLNALMGALRLSSVIRFEAVS